MARLPTRDDLSGPASLRSGRQYASADTTAVGQGLAALGAGVSQYAERQIQQNNVVDLARAEAAKTEGLLTAQNEFDNDPDYSTYGKRAPERTGKVVDGAANLIRDPKMRERWKIGAQTDAVRVNDGIFDKGTRTKREAEVVAFDDALETNRRLYVDPDTSEEVKKKAKADIEGAIQTGLSSGLLDPSSADARRKAYIEDAEFSRGKLAVERDPSIISKPLPQNVSDRAGTAMGYFQSRGWTKAQAAGIVGNLLAESTLNTGARNGGDGADGSDSIGIGQWNSDRAKALKSYAAMNHADWRDFGIQLAFVDHELRNNEKSAGDMLRGATDVRSATEAMIMYERPAGSQNGARNAHNYHGRLKFAAQAAGEQINPDWYDSLSPEQRQIVQNQADTRRNQIAVETRGAIEVATTNAPVAVQNTGSYTGTLPTQEQFFAAYGPEEGSQRFNEFSTAMEVGQTAYDFRTMSAADITQAVEAATPTSTGDNAALETKRYQTLSSAAEATLKAREGDPASYARQVFPAVDQAWANASAEGGYQQAIAASVAAQQQLGVQDIQPLPKEVAASAVKSFKDPNLAESDRIAAATNVLMATPDPAQRQALFEQLVDAGLPEITEGAFEAMSRGDQGASQRLFQAALVDPSKLPGKAPATPTEIDQEVQATLMDTGTVGDIYYGLSNGSTENFERAQRDSKLIANSVNLRMRNGESLNDAIASVSKDLYGDVQVVEGYSGVNAQVLAPADADPEAIVTGLASLLPEVEAAVAARVAVPADANIADGSKAVMDAATSGYVDNVMSEGYFRNSGDGYVFIDPFVGAAISGPDGNPIIFKMPRLVVGEKMKRPFGSPSTKAIDENAARQSVFQ